LLTWNVEQKPSAVEVYDYKKNMRETYLNYIAFTGNDDLDKTYTVQLDIL